VIVTVTMVGERLEIDVFEDGHMEFSQFGGSEAVQHDDAHLEEIIRQHGQERHARQALSSQDMSRISQQNCALETPALLRCGTPLRNGVMMYGYLPAAPRSRRQPLGSGRSTKAT